MNLTPIIIMELPLHTIDLWWVNPKTITDPKRLAAFDMVMNPQEREKQQRLRYEDDRHDALVTRGLVRTVLSKYMPQVEPADWAFEKGL